MNHINQQNSFSHHYQDRNVLSNTVNANPRKIKYPET